MNDKKSKLDLKAQAAWALGNIAGESFSYREQLMEKGFTNSIVNVLNSVYDEVYDEAIENQRCNGKMQFSGDEFYSNIEALVWALSNMCRGGFRVAEYYSNVRFFSLQKSNYSNHFTCSTYQCLMYSQSIWYLTIQN